MRQEEDIRQAVFQYQFLHNASGQQQHAIVYCLSAGEVILSDDFMKRFLGNTPRVVRASACETRFVLFKANKITWENSRKVIVQGGYYEDGDSASGNTYTVVRRITGRWTVTKDKMNWIS